MKIKVTNHLPYQILFGLCICVTYLNIYELTFAVWFFTILLTLKRRYSITLLKYIFPFVAIFFIALISTFNYDNYFYNAIRDITYLIKPILGFIVGYQLCRSYDCKPFQTIINTGFFIAVIHLGMIIYNVIIYKVINIHELRALTGYFSDFEVYALVLVQFQNKLQLQFSKKKVILFMIIIGLSSFLYLSRTNFIQYAILVVAMKGYFKLTKKSLKIFFYFFLFLIIGYSFVYNTNPTRNGKGLEGLFYKIKNAPIEAFKTKINQDDYEDFNDNYRSFENIKTVKQVSAEGIGGILFGKGLGSTVDIGREMWTNDGTIVRYEPILHNAYMTVFLKSGLFGVFFMFYFLYVLSRHEKTSNEQVKNVNLILIGTMFFLFVANWVLLGLFLKLDNKAVIIGFLLCYKEFINKQQKIIQEN